MTNFAERHKEIREKCCLTQEKMAEEFGRYLQERGAISKTEFERTTISGWERGASMPAGESMPLVADFWGVSVDWLYGYEEADMLHPSLRGCRARLRKFLADTVKPDMDIARSALEWLQTEYPAFCTPSFLARRMGIGVECLMEGALARRALENLAEVTGIPFRYWNRGDPRDMGEITEATDADRVAQEMVIAGYTADFLRRNRGRIRAILEEERQKKGGP